MMNELTAEERIDEYRTLFRRMKIAGVAEPYVLYLWEFKKLVEAVEDVNPPDMGSPTYQFNPTSIVFYGYKVERNS